jgi:hypothetical protein
MAKYELEKGCKSVVEIKDENSMKVITSRGDKEFEFDAVFGMDSTQDQVRIGNSFFLDSVVQCCYGGVTVSAVPTCLAVQHLYY